MECDLTYDGPSEKKPGWHRYKCRRAWCPVLNHSPYGIEGQVTKCRGWPYLWELGNAVEVCLEAHNITPDLFHWLGLVEVPEGCNCEARKRWLNTLGGRLCSSRWLNWLARLLVRRALPPAAGLG